MTEITVETSRHIPAWTNARPRGAPAQPQPHEPQAVARYVIDPVAFFIALIGGPLLFTLATCWLYFIPVAALAIGGIPYLVIGTPVLLIHMMRHPVRAGAIASLAASVCIVLGLAFIIVATALGHGQASTAAFFIALCCVIFASFWGASFGWLYPRLARDFYTQPL